MWLDSLRPRYAPGSLRNRYLGLRAFYDWMADEGEIERNPFGPPRARRIKPPIVPETTKDVASRETANTAKSSPNYCCNGVLRQSGP